MIAAVDSGAILGALITVAGSVLLGGIAMAYNLGKLKQTVDRLVTDQQEHRREHERQEATKGERDRVIMALAAMIPAQSDGAPPP